MKQDENTLIILSPGFPKDEADTACLPTQQNIIRAVNKQFPGLEIIIVAFQYPFSRSTYNWYGNTVVAFNGRNKGKLSRFLLWLKVWKKLKQLHKQHHIIGLLSFWCGECALLGHRFGKKFDIKHRSWIFGQDAKKNNKYIKWMKPDPDELIALSDFVADEFEKNFSFRPAHVLPPGIDGSLYGPAVEKDIDIIGVGSFIPLKNYPAFIEVVAKLVKQLPELKVILIGEGPEEHNLRSLIKKHQLQTTIVFSGTLPYKEVLKMMQRSKILLHPSIYEGFGAVNIEALYAGAAVISFTKPMHIEIKNWSNVSNTEEMFEKALEILQNENFSYEKVAAYMIEDTAKDLLGFFLK
ncbi:MAG: glycosyltransferase [Ferruginibacter sp.]